MNTAENTRHPTEAPLPRMEALARLPVFFALDGKRAIVAGSGPGAAWKVELLSAAGARVDVYAGDATEEFADLAAQPPRGPVQVRMMRTRRALRRPHALPACPLT